MVGKECARSYFAGIICVCLAAAATAFTLFVLFRHADLVARVGFAEEQTQIFDAMRAKARKSDVVGAIGCLKYTLSYYPSGTKQIPGSKLDLMVERSRRHAIEDIIEELRHKSGKDLGDDPEDWINNLQPPNGEFGVTHNRG